MSDFEGPGGPDAAGSPLPPPPGAPLLPAPPVALETTVVKRGGSRMGLVVGTVVAVALVAGGLAFLAQGDDGDAVGSLKAAQAVVEESDSYRFEVLTVSREVTGDPDGAGSDTTTRTLTTGEVAGEDEWRIVDDMGEDYGEESDEIETARVGATIYVADPYMTDAGEGAPKWIATSAGAALSTEDIAAMYGDMEELDEDIDGYDDVYRLELMTAAYLFDLEGQPSALTRLVTDATDPAIEEQLADGGVRLRVHLAPLPELAKVAEDPIPPVDLLLDLNADDQPVRAAFTAEAGSSSAKIEVTFSDWGTDISVTPPAEGDIDRTPWLAEEALAQVDPALLIAPSVLPESMELMSATVYSDSYAFLGEDEEPTDDCDSVELSYGTEGELGLLTDDPTVDMSEEELDEYFANLAYLSISVSTADCASGFMVGDFEAELGGRPAGGGDGSWEVKVGDVVVMINSLYEDDVLAPLVASLAPVTVEQLAASVPDWAATSDYYGGWYSGGYGFGG